MINKSVVNYFSNSLCKILTISQIITFKKIIYGLNYITIYVNFIRDITWSFMVLSISWILDLI